MDGVLGLIPARGGSKSILGKNLALLGGQPLISYVIVAGQYVKAIDKFMCSSDDLEIRNVAWNCGSEFRIRPDSLSQDNTPIIDVILHVLERLKEENKYEPWAVALLQPTSPFVLPEYIETCIKRLKDDPRAMSSQTVASFPHNYHAFNQRVMDDGMVKFYFQKEREALYNKQLKPVFYRFGNFVVTRAEALFKYKDVFAPPSIPHIIPPEYALDIDGPEDLEVGEWYLEKKKVILP